MDFFMRLQCLAIEAESRDIRLFFKDFEIPVGGVHIVGGEHDEAHINFASEQDLLGALQLDSQLLCGKAVRLLLAKKGEEKQSLPAVASQPASYHQAEILPAAHYHEKKKEAPHGDDIDAFLYGHDQPLQSRADQQLQSRDDQRLQSRDDQRLQSRDDQRLQSRDDQRLQSRDDQQLQSRDDQQLQSRGDQHFQSRPTELHQARKDVRYKILDFSSEPIDVSNERKPENEKDELRRVVIIKSKDEEKRERKYEEPRSKTSREDEKTAHQKYSTKNEEIRQKERRTVSKDRESKKERPRDEKQKHAVDSDRENKNDKPRDKDKGKEKERSSSRSHVKEDTARKQEVKGKDEKYHKESSGKSSKESRHVKDDKQRTSKYEKRSTETEKEKRARSKDQEQESRRSKENTVREKNSKAKDTHDESKNRSKDQKGSNKETLSRKEMETKKKETSRDSKEKGDKEKYKHSRSQSQHSKDEKRNSSSQNKEKEDAKKDRGRDPKKIGDGSAEKGKSKSNTQKEKSDRRQDQEKAHTRSKDEGKKQEKKIDEPKEKDKSKPDVPKEKHDRSKERERGHDKSKDGSDKGQEKKSDGSKEKDKSNHDKHTEKIDQSKKVEKKSERSKEKDKSKHDKHTEKIDQSKEAEKKSDGLKEKDNKEKRDRSKDRKRERDRSKERDKTTRDKRERSARSRDRESYREKERRRDVSRDSHSKELKRRSSDDDEPPRSKARQERGHVILFNLPCTVTATDLRNYFSEYELAEKGVVMTISDTNPGNLNAGVKFVLMEDAIKAEAMSAPLHGRPIDVQFVSERMFLKTLEPKSSQGAAPEGYIPGSAPFAPYGQFGPPGPWPHFFPPGGPFLPPPPFAGFPPQSMPPQSAEPPQPGLTMPPQSAPYFMHGGPYQFPPHQPMPYMVSPPPQPDFGVVTETQPKHSKWQADDSGYNIAVQNDSFHIPGALQEGAHIKTEGTEAKGNMSPEIVVTPDIGMEESKPSPKHMESSAELPSALDDDGDVPWDRYVRVNYLDSDETAQGVWAILSAEDLQPRYVMLVRNPEKVAKFAIAAYNIDYPPRFRKKVVTKIRNLTLQKCTPKTRYTSLTRLTEGFTITEAYDAYKESPITKEITMTARKHRQTLYSVRQKQSTANDRVKTNQCPGKMGTSTRVLGEGEELWDSYIQVNGISPDESAHGVWAKLNAEGGPPKSVMLVRNPEKVAQFAFAAYGTDYKPSFRHDFITKVKTLSLQKCKPNKRHSTLTGLGPGCTITEAIDQDKECPVTGITKISIKEGRRQRGQVYPEKVPNIVRDYLEESPSDETQYMRINSLYPDTTAHAIGSKLCAEGDRARCVMLVRDSDNVAQFAIAEYDRGFQPKIDPVPKGETAPVEMCTAAERYTALTKLPPGFTITQAFTSHKESPASHITDKKRKPPTLTSRRETLVTDSTDRRRMPPVRMRRKDYENAEKMAEEKLKDSLNVPTGNDESRWNRYIRINDVYPDTSAQAIWSKLKTKGQPPRSVMLVRNLDNVAQFAIAAYNVDAQPKFKFNSVPRGETPPLDMCTPAERYAALTEVPLGFTITEAFDQYKESLVTHITDKKVRKRRKSQANNDNKKLKVDSRNVSLSKKLLNAAIRRPPRRDR